MRPLPEELLLPRGVAEAILVTILEGAFWWRTDDERNGATHYNYDGAWALSPEFAALLQPLIDYAHKDPFDEG